MKTGGAVRREGPEGERDYLDGRGIHCGDVLELVLRVGDQLSAAIPVRYEVDHRRDAEGVTIRVGVLIARGVNGYAVSLDLTPELPVRWRR